MERHAEERRAYQRQWCAANPEKRRAYAVTQNAKPEAKARRKAWRDKQPRKLSKTDAAKESIIREYTDPTAKICDIARRHGLTGPSVTEALRRWQVPIVPRTHRTRQIRPAKPPKPTPLVQSPKPRAPRRPRVPRAEALREERRLATMSAGAIWGRIAKPPRVKAKRGAHRIGKSTHDLWVAKHGREEADRLNAAMKAKMSQRTKGTGNPMYGRPPPEGAMGRLSKRSGLTGWYRDRFFRSLKELTYMMQLDAQGVAWTSAEGLSIPYRWEGHPRTYHPDYRVGDTLVEVKPRRYHRDPHVLAKADAGQTYCAAHGLRYSLIDVEADMETIYQSYLRREVRFTPFAEPRFLDGCASRGMLVMY